MKKLILMLSMLTGLVANAIAVDVVNYTVFEKVSQPVDFNSDLDVSAFERFSVQVNITSRTIATSAIRAGAISSATIVVRDWASLAATPSSATVTVFPLHNTSALTTATFTLNGQTFTEGTHWTWSRGGGSTNTAISMVNAINFSSGNHHNFWAENSSNTVIIHANSSGTFANSFSITSSSPTWGGALSTTVWMGGQDAATIWVNSIPISHSDVLIAGTTSFNAITSTGTTASNIAAAIQNSSNTMLVTASTSTQGGGGATGGNSGIVIIQALTAGVNAYPISVSSPAALYVATTTFFANGLGQRFASLRGGATSEINLDDSSLTENNHGYETGLALLYSTGASNGVIGGLFNQTTYYAIVRTTNTYSLATSSANAIAGTAISITSFTSNAFTYTFAPIAFSTVAAPLPSGYTYLGSNDGVNFFPLVSENTYYYYSFSGVGGTGSAAEINPGLLTLFTNYTYRYLRLAFYAPKRGGMYLKAIFNGRK